jgi:hypothetical protein
MRTNGGCTLAYETRYNLNAAETKPSILLGVPHRTQSPNHHLTFMLVVYGLFGYARLPTTQRRLLAIIPPKHR